MTINDQIRDEKLQYDINREAAKISTLSSGKIHKCEYLTGEDILPSNQQQIIEPARFTYSPLGKAFEVVKTTEDLREKQVDGLKDLKPKEQAKAITHKSDDDNDNTPIREEIYDKILEERMDEILKMSSEIDYKNLVYGFEGSAPSINFAIFGGPVYNYNKLKNGDKTLQQVEKEQENFKKDFNEITSGNPKHKSTKQSYTIFITRDKKLLIYLTIMQELDLKPFAKQNMMKLKEQDLKY